VPPYHAAKWAVGGFTEAVALEVASFGVKGMRSGTGWHADQLEQSRGCGCPEDKRESDAKAWLDVSVSTDAEGVQGSPA
jgi:NAD(P)-dependent dehydrogenase (short-subunit alcohol dehydrogenase family)